jgi:hypothetical protein
VERNGSGKNPPFTAQTWYVGVCEKQYPLCKKNLPFLALSEPDLVLANEAFKAHQMVARPLAVGPVRHGGGHVEAAGTGMTPKGRFTVLGYNVSVPDE